RSSDLRNAGGDSQRSRYQPPTIVAQKTASHRNFSDGNLELSRAASESHARHEKSARHETSRAHRRAVEMPGGGFDCAAVRSRVGTTKYFCRCSGQHCDLSRLFCIVGNQSGGGDGGICAGLVGRLVSESGVYTDGDLADGPGAIAERKGSKIST